MKQVTIDHIEVTDRLIEFTYWISAAKQKESVLFKTDEFEKWLCDRRRVSLNQYWENWDPEQQDSYGHKILWADLQSYFLHKMGALSVEASRDLSLSRKKPMKRVSGAKTTRKGSRSA